MKQVAAVRAAVKDQEKHIIRDAQTDGGPPRNRKVLNGTHQGDQCGDASTIQKIQRTRRSLIFFMISLLPKNGQPTVLPF